MITAAYGLVTGRITSLAFDPADSTGNTLYVGATGGGVWKSTNAAASAAAVVFAPLTDTLPYFSPGNSSGGLTSLTIGALSVQPGGTGVVLAGTGDTNGSLDSWYGGGLLRSTDGGVTWSLIRGTDPNDWSLPRLSFVGEGFAAFAWSTAARNTVVAAVASSARGAVVDALATGSVEGLYYSTDAGATWHLATITDGPGKVIQQQASMITGYGNTATAVVWNPVRQRFYAAVRSHGYYESPDGITFTRMASQPGASLSTTLCPANPGMPGSPSCPIFRGALAVQPATGDLFALTVDSNNQDQGLWQDSCSLRSGGCASPAVTFNRQIPTTPLEAADGSIPLADYSLSLAAVPSQADTLLYAGTQDVFRCSLSRGCQWRNATNTSGCAAARVAPSQHAIGWLQAAPGLIFFGNDGGLWRATDGLQQPPQPCSADDAAHFDNLNGGLGSLAEIGGLAQHPSDPNVLLAGLGALGSAATATQQGAWPQALDGFGSTTAINPENPQNWYANSAGGAAIHQCVQGSACTPAGFGPPAIGNAQVGGDNAGLVLPAPFLLDPLDPTQMIVGTCRVWRGPASGLGWSQANALSGMLDGRAEPFCSGNAALRSLAAGAGPSGEWIYAGMAGALDGGASAAGHLYRALVTGNGTPTWLDVTNSPVTNDQYGNFNPGGYAISGIVIDPHDTSGQTVYVSIQGFHQAHVYRTTDAGLHWLNISGNLPDAPANSVVVDPDDANTLYVALDNGVWVTSQVTGCSDPTINCWSLYGTGLPNAPVTQLLAMSGGGNRWLRAATYGRGIWQIPLLSGGAGTETTANLAPTTIRFADQAVQTTSGPQAITLTNTGSQPLTVTRISTSQDFTETDTCSAVLAPQGSCTVSVSFTPSHIGLVPGMLTVYANLPGGQLTTALSGNGLPGAAVVLMPSSMDFGNLPVGATSPVQNITVSNTGGALMHLGAAQVTGAFSITANTCGAGLAPNYGCTISIVFKPVASGRAAGSFSITDDAGTQSAPLTGQGYSPPTDALSPLSLTFAPQVIGTNSAPQAVTLTNSGDSALATISARTTGDFSVVNQCGNSLGGHSSCALLVVFHPTRVGSEQGTLVVNDVFGKPQSVALSGTGVAPAGISLAPSDLSFGSVGVGGSSTAQTLTLTNNGGSPLATPAFAIDDKEFALASNGCASALGPGQSCTLQMVFSPAQAGPRTGTLAVSSASLPDGLNAALSGVGIDFQLAVQGSDTSTVTNGQAASYLLRLTPVAGSSGTLTIACSGAPANSACSVDPAAVEINGGSSATIAVKVSTGLSQSSVAGRQDDGGWPRRQPFPTGMLVLSALLPAATWRARRMAALLFLAAALFVSGCGVGITGGKIGSPSQSGPGSTTPPGTYKLIVTAAGQGLQRSVTLTLNME